MRVRGSARVLLSFLLVLAAIINTFAGSTASAAQITNRKLTLMANGTVGGSTPGGVVHHAYSFTVPTSGNIGSIQFQYCTTASGTCTMPTGLVTTSATIGGSTGIVFSTINATTNGSPYVTRTAASGSGAMTLQLNSITNPTAANTSFYVRITTYTGANLGGTATDTGVVAASTATQIVVSGIMPESLTFCTGAAITVTANIPNCASATPGNIDLGVFAPDATSSATSMMAASTNALYGYVITVNGTTLTSGSTTIAAMASAGGSTIGTPQFGLNLKLNTTPAVGAEPNPAYDGTNLLGQAAAGYDTTNTYKFVSGETVASSTTATNGQAYTVSYIVNVPGNQLPGTYTTTLTYICTPTF